MKWICNMLLALVLISCHTKDEDMTAYLEPGVSKELATFRKDMLLDVYYDLSFSIPEKKDEAVSGRVDVYWSQGQNLPLILDFRADSSQIISVQMNGKQADYQFVNEHIYIPAAKTWAGENKISIVFQAANQSLNRRDEFLYTLLVPDRARTLFPCFDQPDMKAHYNLQLDVPKAWNAVANGKIAQEDTLSRPGRKLISFQQTEPLPTYLFSFVAGKFKREIFTKDKQTISIYHRETDAKKTAQCPEIARQVLEALSWMEEYTGIPYPFAKYDLIIIPGFQFGGMEHTGATLYNANSMFLNEQPTLDEQLSRSSLIAHETAHMWFGDFVTMKWFDDVWTKEVFANYFAVQIVAPAYPEVNHGLNFIRRYLPPAYAEDRTLGSAPIKQDLDNLRNAGLVYSNIVYDKSPVVMEMLVSKIGKEAYRKGLHDYLETYGYSNATWEQLITTFSKYTDQELEDWSRVWVNENGMPTVKAMITQDSLLVESSDPFGKGRIWKQQLSFLVGDGTSFDELFVEDSLERIAVPLPRQYSKKAFVLPNIDGRGYGFFQMRQEDIEGAFAYMDTTANDLLKGSLLISLFENLQNGTVDAGDYQRLMFSYLKREKSDLLYSMALGYIGTSCRFMKGNRIWVENELWNMVEHASKPQFRLQAFRQYLSCADSPESIQRLYKIWESKAAPAGCKLSESDYIRLSYNLALLCPDKAEEIVKKQLGRISNPDRQAEYRFVSPAVSPDKQVRDSVFKALLNADNRRIEPWVGSAMSLLNHRLREKESIGYIRPALDIMEEIQRTGDIFFPTAWLRSVLSGHTSAEAKEVVDEFWKEHTDFPAMLATKVKQQSDHLYRLNR